MDRIFSEFPFFRSRQNGSGLQYNAIGSLPPTLNLSNNELTGPIWSTFGELVRLHVLDLNGNQLTGSIPDSLSRMRNLEVLDLSRNKLPAEIPHSLVELSFLSKFNVAFNQLQWVIPTGGQFMTFSYSSFKGNLGLCGVNYKPCKAKQTSLLQPLSPSDEQMKIVDLNFAFGILTGFLLSVTYCFTCPSRCLQKHKARKVRKTRSQHQR
ncbi:hypothetical protein SLA2020_011700 [Shorea laevis]